MVPNCCPGHCKLFFLPYKNKCRYDFLLNLTIQASNTFVIPIHPPRTNLSPNIINPEQSCYTFKNGKLFPIAQALPMHPNVGLVPEGPLPPPSMLSPTQRPATPNTAVNQPHQRRRSSPVAMAPAVGNNNKSEARTPQSAGVRKRDHGNR